MRLVIDTEHLKEHAVKLEKINRSALPVAIRGTLNDAVYDVKTRSMPKSAEVFKKRSPNFFKANSKFEKAAGFNVDGMKATVGFYENKLTNQSTNHAVKDLEQQEHGGEIDHKTFIPMKPARVGNKMVRPNLRMHTLKDKQFVKMSRVGKGRNGSSVRVIDKKQQFIRAAIFASEKYGSNAFVLGGRGGKGSRTLSKINDLRLTGRLTKGRYSKGVFTKATKGVEISRTPIYSVRKGRVVPVNPTNFMKRASMETGLLLGKFYIAQAQKQFDKIRK